METKEQAIKNINHIEKSPTIYRPKPKRLYNSYNLIKIPHYNKYKKDNKNTFPLTPIVNSNFNFNKEIFDNYKIKNEKILNSKKKPKLDFDQISIEEIEKDFSKLKAKSEAYKVKKELIYLLRNSNNDNLEKDGQKETLKIKRPKNPFFENINES